MPIEFGNLIFRIPTALLHNDLYKSLSSHRALLQDRYCRPCCTKCSLLRVGTLLLVVTPTIAVQLQPV